MLRPAGVVLATLAAGAVAGELLLLGPGGFTEAVRNILFGVVLLPVSLLFVGASRRGDLPPRLRQGLLLVGLAFLVGAAGFVPLALGVTQENPLLNALVVVPSYLLAVTGVALLPRRALSRAGARRVGFDLAVTLPGSAVVAGTLAMLAREPLWWGHTLVVSTLVQGVLLVALTLLALRGVPLPSPRALRLAIWALLLLLVAQTVDMAVQLRLADRRLFDVAYVAMLLLLLGAGSCYLRDPVTPMPSSLRPHWLVAFNPLPVVTLVALAALVGLAAVRGEPGAAIAAATGLVPLLLVFNAQVLLTNAESVRLLVEEGERDRRQQEERMATVGRLAGGLAHEFNNLMTVVTGHAEFAAEAVEPGHTAQQDLAIIRAQSDRAARITGQLLAFSGQQPLRRQRITVGELSRLAEGRLRVLLRPGVELTVECGAPAVAVAVDAPAILLALDELVSNAVTATVAAGVIEVSCRPVLLDTALDTPFLTVPPGRYLRLAVRDQGVGIPAADLPGVFDPFFAGRAAGPGRGLGLAGVYGIIAAHHGGIRVDTRAGEGTTVALYLPLGEGA